MADDGLIPPIPIANELTLPAVEHAINNLHSQARFMNEYAYRYIRDLLEALRVDLAMPRAVPVLCVVRVTGRLFGSNPEYVAFGSERLVFAAKIEHALVMSEASARRIASVMAALYGATDVALEMVSTDARGLPLAPADATQKPDRRKDKQKRTKRGKDES